MRIYLWHTSSLKLINGLINTIKYILNYKANKSKIQNNIDIKN